jgi:hypothetical protein
MFCAPGLVFEGTKGVGTRYHVLRSRTHFHRCRGHRVPFSYFARPNSFSAVTRVSGPVILFCAPSLVFGCTEGVGSRYLVLRVGTRFHVLRARTRFRLYRRRRVPFSCFLLLDSFSAVSSASFMFYAPGLVFGGTDDVRSRLQVFRARTRFHR